MKIKSIIIAAIVIVGIFLVSIPFWYKGGDKASTKYLPAGVHEVTVKEIIQGGNYTYLNVTENGEKIWLATAKNDFKEEAVLYYTDALEMTDFKSKELDRTFKSIFFVQNLGSTPPIDTKEVVDETKARKTEYSKLENISVPKAVGGITIAELFADHKKYTEKTVKISGVVTKYNPMIMEKNWVHIQDGTENSGEFDLAITTLDSVAVGNTVTFTGKISLDKDFGAGYFYKIIMEEAKATDIKKGK